MRTDKDDADYLIFSICLTAEHYYSIAATSISDQPNDATCSSWCFARHMLFEAQGAWNPWMSVLELLESSAKLASARQDGPGSFESVRAFSYPGVWTSHYLVVDGSTSIGKSPPDHPSLTTTPAQATLMHYYFLPLLHRYSFWLHLLLKAGKTPGH